MNSSGHVGSLDAWLTKATLAKERQPSPFTTVSHTARGAHSRQPMPSARRSTCMLESGQQPLSLAALVRDVPDYTMAFPHEMHGGRFAEEGPVHDGRLRSSCMARSDAQPIARAQCRASAPPPKLLQSAASLPAIATQAAFDFESLCTALSSPASHVTLAMANSQSMSTEPKPLHTAIESTAAADAVTSAFSRSLTMPSQLAPDSTPRCCSGASPVCLLPHICGEWPSGKHVTCTTPESACMGPLFPPVCSPSGRLAAVEAFPGGGVRTAPDAWGSGGGFGRRGLSEGTVRGGIPRN